jgi:hypothetical protein
MTKLDQENHPTKTAESGPDAAFSAVGEAIKARPVEFARALGERLFVIGANIQLFSDPRARADLLALDPRGAAVVVVVEREGEHALLERGLMSAGLVAGWKPEFFFRYPTAGPAAKLRAFLEVPDAEVNGKQRVVLVAHSHDFAVFSASQWLAEQHGIEIWCVQGRIEPESRRLEWVRLESESFRPADSTDTIRVVFPEPSSRWHASGVHRDLGPPLEPSLAPLTASVSGTCRLRTIWRPAPEEPPVPEERLVTEPADSIEQRALQILRDEAAAATHAPAGHPAPAEPAETASEAPGREQPAAKTEEPGAPQELAARRRPAFPEQAADAPMAEPAVPGRGRRPFRIVGLMAVVIVLSAAGLLFLRHPKPEAPARPETATEPDPQPPAAAIFKGTVVDSVSGRPVPGARLYYAGQPLRAGAAGEFAVEAVEQDRRLLVRAAGYRQAAWSLDAAETVRLDPLEVRGYFVSHSQVADASRRGSILSLIRGTSANTVILGVKDVNGRLNVEVDHPLAREIQAASRAAKVDLARQVAAWKAEGIYTVALLALFKDDLLARKRPDLALHSLHSRRPVVDTDGIAWADPSKALVREYNVAVAEAAAAAGFDEIHFDFIRYSSEGLSREGGGRVEYERRLQTLVEFLRAAGETLASYNVYLSASVFGSVCVMPRASVIGQKIEEFAEHVDYISPMLYPSYFEPGKRFPIPLRSSYQLVHENLLRAAHRLNGQSSRLRPWLQNFPDRESPNVPLTAGSIFGQVKAAVDARASGWMLWDARSVYRNTAEAMTMLNSERGGSERPGADAGGAMIPGGIPDGIGGGPPAASAGERFRMMAVLVLAGCCLAVLYGAVRAAWLFREWNRGGPPARLPQQDAAAPAGGAWLPRPEFLRSLSQAGPR